MEGSESCCRVVVLLGHPRPSLAGIGVPWVLTGTHRCASMSRVASMQSANPLWLVLSCSHVSWTWSERCVVVHILSDVGTENTHTPARLEALFTSSQSSQFLPSRIRGSRYLASDCVLNPSKHFRVEICSVALVECILEGVVLELLRLDEICVLLLSFLSPRNS